jgi:hypothetical protein
VYEPDEGDPKWQPVTPAMLGRSLLLTWEVPAGQEEPWRRFLQELSGPRYEEYKESRRRLGISAETTWLAPRSSGGGVAVVYLEAEDPKPALERALRELAAPKAPFDSWYATQMRTLFGCDFAWLPRVSGAELLFSWPERAGEEEQKPLDGS